LAICTEHPYCGPLASCSVRAIVYSVNTNYSRRSWSTVNVYKIDTGRSAGPASWIVWGQDHTSWVS